MKKIWAVIAIRGHADISQRSRIIGEEFNAEGDSSSPQEEARRHLRSYSLSRQEADHCSVEELVAASSVAGRVASLPREGHLGVACIKGRWWKNLRHYV